MTLDEFDARILIELQTNSDLTAEAIGHRVGLSGSAVAKRLRKLNESGLVERHVAVLNLRLIGPSITDCMLVRSRWPPRPGRVHQTGVSQVRGDQHLGVDGRGRC